MCGRVGERLEPPPAVAQSKDVFVIRNSVLGLRNRARARQRNRMHLLSEPKAPRADPAAAECVCRRNFGLIDLGEGIARQDACRVPADDRLGAVPRTYEAYESPSTAE